MLYMINIDLHDWMPYREGKTLDFGKVCKSCGKVHDNNHVYCHYDSACMMNVSTGATCKYNFDPEHGKVIGF